MFKFEKVDELLQTKKLIGISSYQNFPQPLTNDHDYSETNTNSETFLKKYEDKILLWCHCFKDPQNYLPPGVPLLLYSDCDQYNHTENLNSLADTLAKQYDFFCSIPKKAP